MENNISTIYQPLDSEGGIRILLLEPGSDNAEICCSLVLDNLNHAPEYKALSYEWGSPIEPKITKLDGKEVSVTNNLWWALWHLRKNGTITRLWVDALCINQQDDQERGHQVSMMGSIYQNAEVICWLGTGDGNQKLDRAMKCLKAASDTINMSNELLCQELRYGWDIEQDCVGNSSPRARASRASSLNIYAGQYPTRYSHEFQYGSSSNKLLFQDVEAICSHTYWRRTWIIQEAVLGQNLTIWLGDVAIDHHKFFFLCKRILLQNLSELGVLMMDAFRILHLRRQGQTLTLAQLMEFSEHSSCQDLRDRVYAMIGLASDCQEKQIVPDYGKSKTEVYEDVIWMHMHASNLTYDYHGHAQSTVYFSQLVQRAFWPLAGSISGPLAETPDTEREQILLDNKVIEITGVRCGKIKSPCEPNSNDPWWAHPGLVKPFASLKSESDFIPTFVLPVDISTIVALVLLAYFPLFAYLNGVTSYAELLLFLGIAVIPCLVILLKPPKLPTKEEKQLTQYHEQNPIMCFLVHGDIRYIYAPPNTLRDDTICRFQNSGIVAIVRFVEASQRHVLIGRAMILDDLHDIAVYSQTETSRTDGKAESSMEETDPNILISLNVSLSELKDLTSPYY